MAKPKRGKNRCVLRPDRRRLAVEPLEQRRMLSCTSDSLLDAPRIGVPSETVADLDEVTCFAFEATEGTLYDLSATGEMAAVNVSVSDSAFELFAGANHYEVLRWIAPADGTYFVSAREYLGRDVFIVPQGGAYTVTIAEVPYVDDHGSIRTDATPVSTPTNTNGSLEEAGDKDFFAFEATAGELYAFSVSDRNDVSPRTYLRIYPENRSEVLEYFAYNGGEWIAPDTGNYAIELFDREHHSVGDYTLHVAIVDYADDHGNLLDSATSVTVPSSTTGRTEVDGDIDLFAFDAIAGVIYVFPDERGRLIDTSGSELARLTTTSWLAPSTERIYVEIDGRAGNNYQFEVAELEYADDHANIAAGATPISVPSVTNGNIDTAKDADFFSFEAISGTEYNFYTTVQSWQSRRYCVYTIRTKQPFCTLRA